MLMPPNLSRPFNLNQLRSQVRDAQVIFLVDDLNPDHATCVFGKERLRFIIHAGEAEWAKTLRIPICFLDEFDDLEFALAIVEVEKGSYEYQETE